MLRKPRGFGFTLVEVLVVITIIGLLVSMLLPVMGNARTFARNMNCLSNIRGLATSSASYAADYYEYPYMTPAWDTGYAGVGNGVAHVPALFDGGYIASVSQACCPQSFLINRGYYNGWWIDWADSYYPSSSNNDQYSVSMCYGTDPRVSNANPNPPSSNYTYYPYLYMGPVLPTNPHNNNLPWIWINPKYQTSVTTYGWVNSPVLGALQANRGVLDPANGQYLSPSYKTGVGGLLAACAAPRQWLNGGTWGNYYSHGVATVDVNSGAYLNKESRSYVMTDGSGGMINK